MEKNYVIPHCAYNFYWDSDSPPRRLTLKFTLVGTCDDNHYTVILPRPISQGILYNAHVAKYYNFMITLLVSYRKL